MRNIVSHNETITTIKRDTADPPKQGRHFITALSHGLSVLEAVAASQDDIALTTLAKNVKLNKTSTWRLAKTLVDLGYLSQDSETRRFRAAPRVLALGYGYFDGLDLRELASPILRDLSARLGETTNLAIVDQDEVVYIERMKTNQIVNINLHIGSRLPLYNTSLGRALICEMPRAWLRQYISRLSGDPRAAKYVQDDGKKLLEVINETRERGYSMNDQDYVPGLRAIASPIRDQSSKVIAAINISAPSIRVSLAELRRRFVPELLEAAAKLSTSLGYRGSRSVSGM